MRVLRPNTLFRNAGVTTRILCELRALHCIRTVGVITCRLYTKYDGYQSWMGNENRAGKYAIIAYLSIPGHQVDSCIEAFKYNEFQYIM